MEDSTPFEVIKCEPHYMRVIPEPDVIIGLPDGLCSVRKKQEDMLPEFNIQSTDLLETTPKSEESEEEEDDGEVGSCASNVEEIKNMPDSFVSDPEMSMEPAGMFEFVGLQPSSNNYVCAGAASEKSMICKMRANIVKALCVNTVDKLSLSGPKPAVGNELVSHMKMAINTIIGREENSDFSDGESDFEYTSQFRPKFHFCEKCCKFFNRKSSLEKHVLTHLYTCAACNTSFPTKTSLRNHVRYTACGWSFKCRSCGLIFKHKSKLAKHEKVHVADKKLFRCVEKPFRCDDCGKSFMTESFHRRHTTILCCKIVNKCDTCGKEFKELDQLKVHRLTHKTTNPYKCERCATSFKDRNALKLHARKYINEDGYKCELCHKLFLFKSELLKHKVRHHSYRRFSCGRCCSSFKHEGSFEAHALLHSLEPLVCGMCDARFRTDDELRQHKQTHFEVHNCHLCGLAFHEGGSLRKHLHVHINETGSMCSVCGKVFKNKSVLASHALTHNMKKRYS
ncbi:zinc finger protein 234-like isoform X2 [Bacillus rossius redtenbacheri]